MRSVLSSFAFGALLAISAVVSAAGAPGPEIGAWKLNTAKSTGNVPRSETRTYAASADGIVIDYHRVGADGKEVTVRKGEVLRIPSWMPHRAVALEDTLDLDIFSPIREDWLTKNDAYLRRGERESG